jgi:hypothetical protein
MPTGGIFFFVFPFLAKREGGGYCSRVKMDETDLELDFSEKLLLSL